MLRSRLYEMELEKQQAAIGAERRSMVGTGDRSEKIRTYNFPQNRLTDHRIGLTLHQLDLVMEGKLDADHRRAGHALPGRKAQEAGDRRGLTDDHPDGARSGHATSRGAGIAVPRLTAEVCCATRSAASGLSLRPSRTGACANSNGFTTAAICTSAWRASRPSTSPNARNSTAASSGSRPDVLIPRPGDRARQSKRRSALIAGASLSTSGGSGAIAARWLARDPMRVRHATDISVAAIAVAAGNAGKLDAPLNFSVRTCFPLSRTALMWSSRIRPIPGRRPGLPQREVRD